MTAAHPQRVSPTCRLRQRYATRACAAILLLTLGGCVPIQTEPVVTGPEEPSDLTAQATLTTASVFIGQQATLQAGFSGGSGPYFFRWDVQDAPEDVALDSPIDEVITTPTLESGGDYTLRLVVSDSAGHHAADYVTFSVIDEDAAIETDAPSLIIANEPDTLSVTLSDDIEGSTLQWAVVQGTAELDDPTSATPTITAATGETIVVEVTATLPYATDPPTTLTKEITLVSVASTTPQVLVQTTMSNFTIELDAEAAPETVANFLQYVDEGFYDGILFHRVVCDVAESADGPEQPEDETTDDDEETGPVEEEEETIACDPFVVQAGGYRRVDGELERVDDTRDPVTSEADNGLSNATPYSVAMALRAGDPDSGTTEFFINVDGDNGFLDDQEFTVFGMIVDDGGRAVVDAIAAVETEESTILTGETSAPIEDIVIEQISRLTP